MMLAGVPKYRGSINLSSVYKYLTLSLASLRASVTFSSMLRHFDVAKYILSLGLPPSESLAEAAAEASTS